MKRPICFNRILYEQHILEQNKYLGEKINSIKPLINSRSSSVNYKYYFPNNNMTKRQSTLFL